MIFSDFQLALSQIQRSASLIQTGKLDHKTEEVLKTARCGNSDGDFENGEIKFIRTGDENGNNSGKRRVKRFAVGGNRWDTHRLSFDVRNTPKTLSQGQVRRAFRKALGKK